jgi:hypothetical protein
MLGRVAEPRRVLQDARFAARRVEDHRGAGAALKLDATARRELDRPQAAQKKLKDAPEQRAQLQVEQRQDAKLRVHREQRWQAGAKLKARPLELRELQEQRAASQPKERAR